jgi:hypothetical protein
MLILNGQEVISGAYLVDCNSQYKVKTFTADHVVTWDEVGYTLVMNDGADNNKFTLPTTPTANRLGSWFTFANIGTGTLEIEAAGTSVKIADNVQITSGDDVFGIVTVELVSVLQWSIKGAHGTWTSGA